jgi:hypothetical protein
VAPLCAEWKSFCISNTVVDEVAAIGSVDSRRVQLIELCCSETVLGLSECGPLVVNNVYKI